jgi:hypothetical protein
LKTKHVKFTDLSYPDFQSLANAEPLSAENLNWIGLDVFLHMVHKLYSATLASTFHATSFPAGSWLAQVAFNEGMTTVTVTCCKQVLSATPQNPLVVSLLKEMVQQGLEVFALDPEPYVDLTSTRETETELLAEKDKLCQQLIALELFEAS